MKRILALLLVLTMLFALTACRRESSKPGCRFAPRCPYANEGCSQPQELVEVETGHFVSCHRVKEIN